MGSTRQRSHSTDMPRAHPVPEIGGNPQPDGVIIGAGTQILNPEIKAEIAWRPGQPYQRVS